VYWKICGVRSLHAGRLCAEMGADFLGLHAINVLTNSDAVTYRAIAREVERRFPLCSTVLVTKARDPGFIAGMLRRIQARIIQIHCRLNEGELRRIVRQIQDVLGHAVTAIGVISMDDVDSLGYCRQIVREAEVASFFLVDSSWRGGTGRAASSEKLREIVSELNGHRVLLAGGLTPENVYERTCEIACVGVDVQSGVEFTGRKGIQDPRKVRQFAQAIGKREAGRLGLASPGSLVSLAIAGLSCDALAALSQQIYDSSLDAIHVDEADGSLTPGFVSHMRNQLRELGKELPIVPVDLHFMIKDVQAVCACIEDYSSIHPLLGTVYAHSSGFDGEPQLIEGVCRISHDLGLKAGIAFDASWYSVGTLSESLDMLHRSGITRVAIVCRSGKHGIGSFGAREVLLLRLVRAWNAVDGSLESIAVDRDLNEDRLNAMRDNPPNHLISGKLLLSGNDLEGSIVKFRQAMDKGSVEAADARKGG
jgi:phosphoribosylanthranilate isomerase